MKTKTNTGLYRLTNKVNGKIYIGSSIQLDIRWAGGNRKTLRGNYSHNAHLQRAWNKYGEDAFIFDVIEYVPDDTPIKMLQDVYEQKWIDETNCCDSSIGYNIAKIARGGGFPMTEDAKENLRILNTGRKASAETRKKISDGYMPPSDPDGKKLKLVECNLGDKNPMYGKFGKEHPRARRIIQYDKSENELKIWDSVNDIVRELKKDYPKIVHSNIVSCCNGNLGSAYGFVWRYADDMKYKRVRQLSIDGISMSEYDSVKEAAMAVDGRIDSIYKCCWNYTAMAYGFIWEYIE